MVTSPGVSARICKLLIKVVIGILFCMIIVAYFHAAFHKVMVNEQERTKRVANNIELHLQGRLMALKLLANAPNIRNLDRRTVKPQLERTIGLLDLSNAFIFDTSGNIVGSAAKPNFPQWNRDGDSFAMTLKGYDTVSSRVNSSDVHDAFISLNVPIYSQKKVAGVLSAGVSLYEIAELVSREQMNEKHYVYVMDNKSQFIYHPRLNEIYPESDKYSKHLVDLFSQSSGNFITTSVLDGDKKLYVYTSVQYANWRVVSVMPMSAVFTAVMNQSKADVLAVLLLILSIVFLYYLLHQFKRHQEEREALRMERLMTVNQMAAGMAHEIRNPLTAIKGFIQLLQRKADKPLSKSYLDIVFTELDRIERLANEFQMLAKPVKPLIMQRIDLAENISNIILLVKAQAAGRQISVEFYHPNNGLNCYVQGDEAQLKQVWLNLLRNALEAIKAEGKIEVRLFSEGDQAVVQVKDNGAGISQAILSQIGTPFFTTKETGTGLGLSVCYNIINSHGGKIHIDSKEGEGTIFKVLLPLTNK